MQTATTRSTFAHQPPASRASAWLGVLLALAVGGGAPTTLSAAEIRVAVAANFTAAMREIAAAFEQTSGHTLKLSFGSTGKLYAQIVNGAPFDVFLSADQARPQRLVEQRRASGRFTYAIGRLALWSRQPGYVSDGPGILQHGEFRRLAVANPKTAPYGVAAMQVLERLGVAAQLRGRLVRGDSIAQTYQFVATGNAELGFVALAQLSLDPGGSHWLVPQSMHDPLRQDAALLDRAADPGAATEFLAFLRGPRARAIIEQFGYATS